MQLVAFRARAVVDKKGYFSLGTIAFKLTSLRRKRTFWFPAFLRGSKEVGVTPAYSTCLGFQIVHW